MSGEIEHSDGRRTVGLYIPFTAAGKRIESITFEPCTFGHLLRWQGGLILGSVALMAELSGRTLHEIESIRRPDDQRVMTAFLDHIHPEIAQDVANGVRPIGNDYEPSSSTNAAYGAQGGAQAAGAPDPFDSYEGFDPEPTERPSDWVEGLDN